VSRRSEVDGGRLEAAKRHVRRQLAIYAGHPDEAEIPSDQRAPLGRHFDLASFDSEMIEKLGVLGVWSQEALFRKFTHIDESSIEPSYCDNSDGQGDHPTVEILEENTRMRNKLAAELGVFQLNAINLLAEYAEQDVAFYRLFAQLDQRISINYWNTTPKIREIIANVRSKPEPKGKGGAKKSTHFKRDLLLLSLIQNLVDSFADLAKTGAQNTERGDEACSIVTTVWNEEFRDYTEILDGEVKKPRPARRLPATTARNVWVNWVKRTKSTKPADGVCL
jgi:hypothetical protein